MMCTRKESEEDGRNVFKLSPKPGRIDEMLNLSAACKRDPKEDLGYEWNMLSSGTQALRRALDVNMRDSVSQMKGGKSTVSW